MGLILISWNLFGQNLDQLDDATSESNTYYSIKKLHLNTTPKEDFEKLLILSPLQIQELISFRNKHYFNSIFELQTLDSWDLETCHKILPYLLPISSSQTNYTNKPFKLIIRSNTTLEEKKGFSPPTKTIKTRYLGDPWGHYLRLQDDLGLQVQYGLTLQKDAGETNYLDFSSAFIQYNIKDFKLILGDYSNQWSQGLILGGGFFLGKSYQTILSTQKIIQSARPYTSSGESNFNRGIYLEKLFGPFRFELNLNRNFLDATTSLVGEKIYFNTLYTDGYHRTSSELKRRNSVAMRSLGTSVNYISKKYQIDFNFLYQEFNPEKAPSKQNYLAKSWYGNELKNFSLGYSIHPNNLRWVGELAYGNHSWATVHGLIFPYSKKLNASVLFRFYQSGYYSIQSNGFRENSTTGNELGIYFGQEINFSKRKKLWIYQDLFLFPDIKYQVSQKNTLGWEIFGRMQWNKTNFSQLKYQSKQEDGEASSLIRLHQFQFLEDYYFEKKFRYKFHSRLFLTAIKNPNSWNTGFSILFDEQTKFKNLKIILREWLFFTEDYDSRIYSYEPGLLYNFAIPSVYDHGIRFALVLEQRIAKIMHLGLKISRLHYFNKNTIGSSYEEIQGKNKTDINLQLIISH